uniref:BZIP domain-containing protein n=1 Tax=Rhizophora mucronata TaxID=61149 RepID=A0A2P2P0T8_RHIMU
MENGWNFRSAEMHDGLTMVPYDQKEHSRSRTDIMTRRLKNRERQRRYRARKRLEAEMKRTPAINQSAAAQIVMEMNVVHNSPAAYTYCTRDWKKDARRAHASKSLEEAHCAAAISAMASNIECRSLSGKLTETPQERNFHSENCLSLLSSETDKTNLGRRDWKAEARQKKC